MSDSSQVMPVLRHHKKRLHDRLLPLCRDRDEQIRCAQFIDAMPWSYARDVDVSHIAAHWKMLRTQPFVLGELDRLQIKIKQVKSWIGSADMMRLSAVFRKLDPGKRARLLRAYFHKEAHFVIVMSHSPSRGGDEANRSQTENIKVDREDKGVSSSSNWSVSRDEALLMSSVEEEIRPPGWLSLLREQTLLSRKEDHSIFFDAIALENVSLLRIQAVNTARTTVVRTLFEILDRHQVLPASVEIWSERPVEERRIKERHSIEITVAEPLDDEILDSIRLDISRYLSALLKVHSLFDIVGPAMVGPSSSHTAGAARIGQLFRQLLFAMQDAGYFNKLTSISVELLGSFRDSGPGHGTHIAVAAGLKGYAPDSEELIAQGDPDFVKQTGITWRDGTSIPFTGFAATTTEDDAGVIKSAGDCANVARLIAKDDAGNCHALVGYSIGGGLIEIRQLNGRELQPYIMGKQPFILPSFEEFNALAPDAKLTLLQLPSGDISGDAVAHKGVIGTIYTQTPPRENVLAKFNTFEEVLELCAEQDKTLLQLAIELEIELQGGDEAQVVERMGQMWHVMKQSVRQGLESSKRSLMNLSGGESAKLLDFINRSGFSSLHTLSTAYAMASSETNAQMGRIVAAPTAGACGIIPGVLLAWHDTMVKQGEDSVELEKRIINALLVSALIGMIFYDDIPTAGATLGCQAEIGIAASMASAALVDLCHGTPEESVHSAIITLKNCMGLVCDPVAGLVEVPCIKRNAMFSNFAVTSANMAMSGIYSQIPPDQVVLAVKEVGERMHSNYKETAKGGLATTLSGKDISRRFAEHCSGVFCHSCTLCG